MYVYFLVCVKCEVGDFESWKLNPFAAETRIFLKNYVDTTAADALAPYVAGTWAAVILTMQDKRILVFYKEGFQLPAATQFWEMIRKC